MAEEAKLRVNAAFSSGDSETAIRHLTEASVHMDIREEEESPKHEPETDPMQVTEEGNEEKAKRKKAEAMKEKEAGNASYLKKEFEDAKVHYTKAMELDDEDISYITNRAAVYLEMGNFVECVKDCEKAVERGRELRADYKIVAKALKRKGTALVRMAKSSKDYEPAIEAFQRALTEHRNPDTLKKLNEAEKAKKDLEQQERMEGMDPLKVIQWKRLMDACRADPSHLSPLKTFIDICKTDPSILSEPIFSFFRDYLESLGAKLPASAYEREDDEDEAEDAVEVEPEAEVVESDIELEGDVMEPDNDPPQKMGDASVEVTDENREAAQDAKVTAMEALSEGKFDEAIDKLTEAILLNPTSAIMYATRATAYIKMKKPNAAIRDANAAIEINPDSSKGYKSRGIARSMLGQWQDAAKDLQVASKLDYEEEINTVLKKVNSNVRKIEDHRRKYERLCKEREDRKIDRERQRRQAKTDAKKREQSSSSGRPGGFPRGCTIGAIPADIEDYNNIMNDPELVSAFSDSEIMAGLQNASNSVEAVMGGVNQSNPNLAPIIAKMVNKLTGRVINY